MMSSSSSSSSSSIVVLNLDSSTTPEIISRESKNKRKRNNLDQNQLTTTTKWRTESEQRIYSSKLLEALRRVGRSSNSPPQTKARGRVVREAADRALAFAAKGRTRWSRAILTSSSSSSNKRVNLKLKKKNKLVVIPGRGGGGCSSRRLLRKTTSTNIVVGGDGREKKKKSSSRRVLGGLEKKVRVLGGLVPGCSKGGGISFPDLLEETSDYIAAMEMQIRTMTLVTHLLLSPTPPQL